ncbi:aspartate ammonia-lyase [Clostridia bacterium]|nr:aspartate ammonia-lyase [Clostridia bacterium]
MKNDKKLPKGLSGVSGEYFVAAELSRRGYIAAITSKNTKDYDLLVSNFEDSSESEKTLRIQVKTNQGSRKSWLLSKKCEDIRSESTFYVFVNLNGLEIPDYYIVPSNIVAEQITESHKKWVKEPGRNNKEHKDTSMRMFNDEEELYLNRWDLLDL